jgi:Leucine-rich repeat (LRR) protein
LRLSNWDDRYGPLDYITEDIYSLTSLEYLYLVSQNISIIPIKIKELTKLALLDLWSNPIAVIPHELIELSSLKALYLSGENSIIPYINVLLFLKSMEFKGNLEIGKLWSVIQDDLDKKRGKREKR